MYILGINISHHASICLLKNGEIVFYLEEDRLTRIKEKMFTVDDKILSLKKVFLYTNYVDHVIFTSYGKQKFFDNFDDYDPDDLVIAHVKEKLKDYNIKYGEVHFHLEHHLYHACNGFYSSIFEESAVLVLDGGGFYYNDFLLLREIESMYYFSGNTYKTLYKNYSNFNPLSIDKPVKYKENVIFSSTLSCGRIFNFLGSALGGIPAGKIMGLSSYGDHLKVPFEDWYLYDNVSDTWFTDNKKIYNCFVNYLVDDYQKPFDLKSNFKKASDVSKKAQIETKNNTIRLIKKILETCNTKNIVLSGGYFLNCVNNYEYLKEFPNINFYIDPIAHDGGTSMGSAKYIWHCFLNEKKRFPLKTLYLD